MRFKRIQGTIAQRFKGNRQAGEEPKKWLKDQQSLTSLILTKTVHKVIL